MSAPKCNIKDDGTSFKSTGIPRGNPQRYQSRGVLRMSEDGTPFKDQRISTPMEEIETEASKQLKALAKKQLDTNVTLEGQLSSKKSFTKGTVYKPVSEEVSGALELSQFKQVTSREDRVDILRHAGLTDEEIRFKLQDEETDNYTNDTKRARFGLEPDAYQNQLDRINTKISQREQQLNTAQTFGGLKVLSRHEMDLEKAISRGTETSKLTSALITQKCDVPLGSKDPIYHLDTILNDAIKSRSKTESSSSDSDSSDSGSDIDEDDEFICKKCRHMRKVDPDWMKHRRRCRKCDRIKDKLPLVGPLNWKDTLKNKEADISCQMLPSYKENPWESVGIGAQKNSKNKLKNNKDTISTKKLNNQSEILNSAGEVVCADSVVLIPEEAIVMSRLTCEQIKEIPRFSNYQTGEPTKTLYLKNLSPKVTVDDLVALFIRFEKPNLPKLTFKLLTGKMKGQAFVTFQDIDSAKEALNLVNGYNFRGKPIVILYGRK